MGQELEAKYKVADFAAVRDALAAAGAVYRGTAGESDVFFDTPDRKLYHGDRALRLRRIEAIEAPPGGLVGGWLLTSKGPPGENTRAKVRHEVQTRIEDGEAMAEILRGVGMVEFRGMVKRRSSYVLGDCLVELDEVSPLGCFVEIEAPDEQSLQEVRSRLGLPDQPITESYLKLVDLHGRG